MKFSDIPLRLNGKKILYAWFDALRAAGIRIESVLGGGITSEIQFTIANNQSSYSNITSMTIDGSLYIYAEFRYSIYRISSGVERRETGSLELEYLPSAAAWRIANRLASSDALNIADSFSVTTVAGIGQVKYKSDNFAAGKMRWKTLNTIGVET